MFAGGIGVGKYVLGDGAGRYQFYVRHMKDSSVNEVFRFDSVSGRAWKCRTYRHDFGSWTEVGVGIDFSAEIEAARLKGEAEAKEAEAKAKAEAEAKEAWENWGGDHGPPFSIKGD